MRDDGGKTLSRVALKRQAIKAVFRSGCGPVHAVLNFGQVVGLSRKGPTSPGQPDKAAGPHEKTMEQDALSRFKQGVRCPGLSICFAGHS